MTKAKNTKRALLASMLSMLMCMAMLIGSTFAWFSDTVSSGKNTIVTGILDIELEVGTLQTDEFGNVKLDKDKNPVVDWKRVEPTTNIFDKDALWEPGRVEVVYLRVVNAGTLALKYSLGINVAKELGSTNILGNKFYLSDYIEYAVLDGVNVFKAAEDGSYSAREAAINAPGEDGWHKLSELADVDGEDHLLAPEYDNDKNITNPDDSCQAVTLMVCMPEDVDNNANYDAAKADEPPYIDLGVNLFATQHELEPDSFGYDYDKDLNVTAHMAVSKAMVKGIADANKNLEKNPLTKGKAWFDDEMTTEEDGSKSINLHLKNDIAAKGAAVHQVGTIIETAVNDKAEHIDTVVVGCDIEDNDNAPITHEINGIVDNVPNGSWVFNDLLKIFGPHIPDSLSIAITDISGVTQVYTVNIVKE